MDKRVLKTGQIRLRFKLSELEHHVVTKAIKLVDCRYDNTAIDWICIDFLAGTPTKTHRSASGSKRFLVRLYPDQYETVQLALGEASRKGSCEEDALAHICAQYIKSISIHSPSLLSSALL